jgi:hypothetical protein
MAGFDYTAAQKDADDIIREFARRQFPDGAGEVMPGKLRILTASGGSAYEPGTHGKQDTPCIMVVVDYEQNERDDTIQTKDRRIMISPLAPDGTPLSVEPTTAYKVVLPWDDRTAYEIVRVKPFDPAGVDVFYDLQVRFG